MSPSETALELFEGLAENDTSVFDTHCHAHLEVYGAVGDPPRGRDEMRQSIAAFHTIFSDYRHEVHDVIATDDKVVLRCTSSGVHIGAWNGIPATGKAVRYADIFVLHFEGDLIARAWLLHDDARLMQQLGSTLAPAEASKAP